LPSFSCRKEILNFSFGLLRIAVQLIPHVGNRAMLLSTQQLDFVSGYTFRHWLRQITQLLVLVWCFCLLTNGTFLSRGIRAWYAFLSQTCPAHPQ
jgi:hypothetical protein